MMMHNTIATPPAKSESVNFWFQAGSTADFPDNGGLCFKYGDLQIAVFNFSHRDEWYACQNLCPHRMQMVLSRGLIGSQQGEPKVSCPFHKKSFSLQSGKCLNDDECAITTYPVKVIDGMVYIGLSTSDPASHSNTPQHVCA